MIKALITIFSAILLLCGCTTNNQAPQQSGLPIAGTWQLISGSTIEKGDTTVTNYTRGLSFIKIINDTHFAFLKHDLKKGKDSTAAFSSGGGSYMLKDNQYTEHLEYCSDREWEGNDFTFTISIQNDTLIQSGTEKVENAGINRINIEKYTRVKK
ncbi:MAG: hypothetical protein ABI760_18000 [Ferruginibacter sp.]